MSLIISGDTGLVFPNSSVQPKAPYGKQTIWIPAGALIPAKTSGPEIVDIETTTNLVNQKVYAFDPATPEYAHFTVLMPKSWNGGTVSFRVVWSHTATTEFGVVFTLQGNILSNDSTFDVALPSNLGSIVDTGGVSGNIYITDESDNVIIEGTPTNTDLVLFRFKRAAGDALDTLAIDAYVHGIQIYYTTDTQDDA